MFSFKNKFLLTVSNNLNKISSKVNLVIKTSKVILQMLQIPVCIFVTDKLAFVQIFEIVSNNNSMISWANTTTKSFSLYSHWNQTILEDLITTGSQVCLNFCSISLSIDVQFLLKLSLTSYPIAPRVE